jgi:hypothetical protein
MIAVRVPLVPLLFPTELVSFVSLRTFDTFALFLFSSLICRFTVSWRRPTLFSKTDRTLSLRRTFSLSLCLPSLSLSLGYYLGPQKIVRC